MIPAYLRCRHKPRRLRTTISLGLAMVARLRTGASSSTVDSGQGLVQKQVQHERAKRHLRRQHRKCRRRCGAYPRNQRRPSALPRRCPCRPDPAGVTGRRHPLSQAYAVCACHSSSKRTRTPIGCRRLADQRPDRLSRPEGKTAQAFMSRGSGLAGSNAAGPKPLHPLKAQGTDLASKRAGVDRPAISATPIPRTPTAQPPAAPARRPGPCSDQACLERYLGPLLRRSS